jgi:hypothetical protein
MASGPRDGRKAGFMTKFAVVLLLSVVCCSAEVIVGPLTPGNILDWDLTVSDPTQGIKSSDILGPLSGSNSEVGLVGSDLTETSTELFFNFSGTDHGYLLFQSPTLFNGSDFWCSANSAYSGNPSDPVACSNQPAPGEAISTKFGATEPTPLSGDLVIASGGTASGADIIYDVDQSWTTDHSTFSVTGTVTTGPIPVVGAVPEPSALGFLALAMAAMGFWKFRASRSS